MQTQAAKLSSKGKVVIPKEIIAKHRWKSGQEIEVIDTEDGILLKSASAFRRTCFFGSNAGSCPAGKILGLRSENHDTLR